MAVRRKSHVWVFTACIMSKKYLLFFFLKTLFLAILCTISQLAKGADGQIVLWGENETTSARKYHSLESKNSKQLSFFTHLTLEETILGKALK